MKDNLDCSYAKEMLLEEIEEGMTAAGFQIFLSKHECCESELKAFYETIQLLDNMETAEPSTAMDEGFYAKLAAEPTAQLRVASRTNWVKNIAVAASIFMVGALAGFYFFNNPGMRTDSYVQAEEVNDHLMLASNSSISRLEEISEMRKAPELNDKIIDALNSALLNDPNVNVRLSAIEAMLHYADNPKVRENLIKAIPYQHSAIIQMTLAEVMIGLAESDSKDEWLELFESDKLGKGMKEQLEETLAPVLKL